MRIVIALVLSIVGVLLACDLSRQHTSFRSNLLRKQTMQRWHLTRRHDLHRSARTHVHEITKPPTACSGPATGGGENWLIFVFYFSDKMRFGKKTGQPLCNEIYISKPNCWLYLTNNRLWRIIDSSRRRGSWSTRASPPALIAREAGARAGFS
jgi:hypothetical protein